MNRQSWDATSEMPCELQNNLGPGCCSSSHANEHLSEKVPLCTRAR